MVPRFNLGRLGLSLLLEGQIDFLKARSIRGNITIEQTTTMEASSRIRNVVTIRSLSISSQLICQKRSIGSQNGGPRLVRKSRSKTPNRYTRLGRLSAFVSRTRAGGEYRH
jgi:hypothetical protein